MGKPSDNNDTTFDHIETVVNEFIQEETERQIKEFPHILEINGQQVDIDSTYMRGGICYVCARYLPSDQRMANRKVT